MKTETKKHFFRCHLHCDKSAINHGEDCQGKLITRKSILGAIQRSCQLAWEKMEGFESGIAKFNINGWPEILKVEELESVQVNSLYDSNSRGND